MSYVESFREASSRSCSSKKFQGNGKMQGASTHVNSSGLFLEGVKQNGENP